jgi:integrase
MGSMPYSHPEREIIMPRRSAPLYRLHKASGRATVTIDGRDIYLGPHGSPESLALYDELVRAHLRQQAETDRKRRSDLIAAELEKSAGRVDWTVAELVLRYLPHVRGHYVKAGVQTSQVGLIEAALGVLVAKSGELDASRFGPLALKACRDEFVARGHTRNEANRRTRLIVQMFRWCTEQELVQETVWSALRSVKALQRGRTTAPDKAPITPATDADVEAALPHMPRPVAAMVRIQALAGLRPGEVIMMRPEDIDMTGAVWEYTPATHKTEHRGGRRVIMIGPKAQGIIREFLRPRIGVFEPGQPTSPYVFPPEFDRKPRCDRKREPGDRYTVNSYRRAIARACARAGVPEFGPNRLRHSAATRIRRELGLDVARALLGHTDVSTTTIYAERDDTLARAAMEKFG